MPKAPIDTADPLQLADWLEVRAVCAEDHLASSYHLISLLRLATTADEQQEQLLQDTFSELQSRATAAQSGYPFTVSGSVLKLKTDDWREYPAYFFCLLVSVLGVSLVKRPDPARLFEKLAKLAAARLVAGMAERFGFPRRGVLPRRFAAAVATLCSMLHEGGGLNPAARVYDEKDDALDVVAWKSFPDGLPGQLLLFGQCAAGKDWKEKRRELEPSAFCKKWLLRFPVSPLIKAFFVPHRVDGPSWDHLGYDAGLVVDRCRIAYLAHGDPACEEHIQWLEAAILRTNSES